MISEHLLLDSGAKHLITRRFYEVFFERLVITEGLVSNLRFVIQTDENCVINIKCVVRVKDRMNFCAVAQQLSLLSIEIGWLSL